MNYKKIPFYLILLFLIVFPFFEGLGLNIFLLPGFYLLSFFLCLSYYQKKIKLDFLLILNVIFLISVFISTIFSLDFTESLNKFFQYFALLIVFNFIRYSTEDKKTIKLFLFILILLVSFSLCIRSFFYLIFPEFNNFQTLNLIVANYGHNHLINYLIFSFPLVVCSFLWSKKKISKILWLTAFLFLLVSIFFTFSRIGIILCFFELLLVIAFFAKKKRIIFVLTGLAGIIFLFFIFLSTKSILYNKIFREFTFKQRINYWQQAISGIKENPLFGTGLGTFVYSSTKYQKSIGSWSAYAHNHFLEVAIETGIIGGLAFLILILTILKKGYKISKESKDPLIIAFYIGVLFSSIHSLFDFDWNFFSISLTFWVLAGFILGWPNKNPEHKKAIANPGLFKITIVCLSFIIFIFSFLEGLSFYFLLKGLSEIDKKRTNESYKYFTLAVYIYPLNKKRFKEIGKKLYEAGEFNKSLFYLKDALLVKKNDWQLYKNLAQTSERLNDDNQAINFYKQAIELNPKGDIELYLNLTRIYQKKKETKKLNELLENFFFKTKHVKEFWPQNDKAREMFLLSINYFVQEDPNTAFQILERMESTNDWEMFEFFGWEGQRKILQILLDFDSQDLSLLTDKQKAKYYFWLAGLTISDDDKESLLNKKSWLEKAAFFDKENNYYLEFNKNISLLVEAQERIYWTDYQETIKVLEKTSFCLENKNPEELAFFEKFMCAIYFDFLAQAQAGIGDKKAKDSWQKASEYNPGRKDYENMYHRF